MTIQKFRKKPVVIEAMQFQLMDGEWGKPAPYGDLESAEAIRAWSDGKASPEHYHPEDGWCAVMYVSTLEGSMRVNPGDWIIKGVKGEFYPCKPDIFAASYEPA